MMKLIAKKPCSFGGRKFYIGQEIPAELVAEPGAQERLGVLTVVTDDPDPSGIPDGLFNAGQVEEMISNAVAEARQEYEQEIFDGAHGGVIAEEIADAGILDAVAVPVAVKDNGDSAEMMSVPLTHAEVQKVFTIMQMTVPDAEKAIDEVEGENILIVLHACDSRAGVKKAAKNRADKLNPAEAGTEAAMGGNEATRDAMGDGNRVPG